ncbi:proline-rich protein 11 isoform X3 [Hydra vulgaris]|uniref:Proline-rich protein 11 isoform X3 n=1 Tax=Hydra vulgaris TaxID=6087 RepID=A0ABM4CQB7_HYDVU
MAFKNGKKKHRMGARRSNVYLMKSKQAKHLLSPSIVPVANKDLLLKVISPILCLCRTISKIFLIPRWLNTFSPVEKIDILEKRILYLEHEVSLLKTQNKLLSIPTCHTTQSATSLPSLSLPPQPPPPPPLPVFVLPSQHNSANIKSCVMNPSESRLATDELLKDIKLRKVLQTNVEHTVDEEKKVPLVSVQDIKNVKLKKTVCKRTQHRTPPFNMASTLFALRARNINIKKSSGNKKSPGDVIRRHLRKVPVKRSPGGTPMVLRDFSKSTGEGLTPMLSNALKDKFKNASENVKSSPCTPNITLQFDCEAV